MPAPTFTRPIQGTAPNQFVNSAADVAALNAVLMDLWHAVVSGADEQVIADLVLTLTGLRNDAETAETGAVTAQGLAEAARDATVIAAAAEGLYSDTTLAGAIAAGLAATVDGDSFYAVGEDADFVGLYLNDTGSEDEVARLPKFAVIEALTNVFDPGEAGDDFHEFRAADGSVLLRLDAGGARGPVLAGRRVAAMDTGGRERAHLTDSDRRSKLIIEGGDGRAVMEAYPGGLAAGAMRPTVISSSRDMRMGFPTDRLIPAVAAGAKGLRQINHVMGLGRSLMDGRHVSRYTVPRFRNLAISGANTDPVGTSNLDDVRGFIPCTALARGVNEQYIYLAAEHATALTQRHKGIDPLTLDCRWLVSECAIGGQNIQSLIDATYGDIRGQIASAKALAEAWGITYHFAGFLFVHADNNLSGSGSDNSASPAQYRDRVEEYMAACRAIVEDETGQIGARVPWFFAAQNSTHPLTSDNNIAGQMQALIARSDEYAFVPFSNHPVERATAEGQGSDNIHISGYGTAEGGIMFGRALYRHYFTSDSPDGLLPVAAWAQGSDVFVRFNRGPLTTRSVSHPDGEPIHDLQPHFGLAVSNNAPGVKYNAGTHTAKAITASAIVSDDTVRITLASPAADGDYLRIGGSGLSVDLDPDLYGDTLTDDTFFEPYEIAAPTIMRIITNA